MVASLVPEQLRNPERYPEYQSDVFYGDNAIAKNVFKDKYAAPEDYWLGQPNLYRFWERLAWGSASVEREDEREYWYHRFLGQLEAFRYMYGGRINYGHGRYGVTSSLQNCYVTPIEDDSLYGIFECLTKTAKTYAKHGGVGNHISMLRPRGADLRSATIGAPGAVSFMDLFSSTTGSIAQDGRRGAEIITIDDWHPDTHDFVDIKNDGWSDLLDRISKHTPVLAKRFNDSFGDRRKVSFANISPHLSDEFMEAVINDSEFEYRFPDIANCPAETDPEFIAAWRKKYSRYLVMFDGYELGSDELEQELDRRQASINIYDTRWNGDLPAWERMGYPVKVHRKEKARILWRKIVHSAWKSAEPGLIFKGNFQRAWTADDPFLTTNPCVTADTWVLTKDGPKQVSDLIDVTYVAVVNGKEYQSTGFWQTGTKEVLELKTNLGFSVKLTNNHKVLRRNDNGVEEWVEAGELKLGDRVVLNNHRGYTWEGEGTFNEGWLLGQMVGDGGFNPTKYRGYVRFWGQTRAHMLSVVKERAVALGVRADFATSAQEIATASAVALDELAAKYITPGTKQLLPNLEKASSKFYRGFLQGFFDADGSIQGTSDKGFSVRLAQSDIDRLVVVQRMLARFGIISKIYPNRKQAQQTLLPDGRGGQKLYNVRAYHELVITGGNLHEYSEQINFADPNKSQKLAAALGTYTRGYYADKFVAKVVSMESVGTEPVYDCTVDEAHAFDANGIMVHNCGEIGLAPNESCNLGSHNLAAYVTHPGANDATFNFNAFDEACFLAVRMQDNIHSANEGRQALRAQEVAAKKYRRLGIGITGLADMLVFMGLRYDSQEALELVEKVMQIKNEAEYRASAMLAAEKGVCPGWNLDTFKRSTVWSTLSDEVKELIEANGLRNIATSTIAPTGTVSLVAKLDGTGLEPMFSVTYERRVKQEDGSYRTYQVAANCLERIGITKEHMDGGYYMPDFIVTAAEVDIDRRVEMQAILGKYTSNSISSTINLPKWATEDDVERIYINAYKLGLKGVTVYRDGSRAGILRHIEDEDREPGRVVARTPDELPALRIVRKSGKMKFYFTLSLKNESPYELFVDTNRRETDIDTGIAVDSLLNLARTHGVEERFIEDQVQKSLHQINTRRIGRMISLNLRHGVPVDDVIQNLSELPTYSAGSLIFHIVKVLAAQMPDGYKAKGDCPSCNATGTMRYEGGCVICSQCGYSKCG